KHAVGPGSDVDQSAGGDDETVSGRMIAAGVFDPLRFERSHRAEWDLPFDGPFIEIVSGELGPGRADRGTAVVRVQSPVRSVVASLTGRRRRGRREIAA